MASCSLPPCCRSAILNTTVLDDWCAKTLIRELQSILASVSDNKVCRDSVRPAITKTSPAIKVTLTNKALGSRSERCRQALMTKREYLQATDAILRSVEEHLLFALSILILKTSSAESGGKMIRVQKGTDAHRNIADSGASRCVRRN